MGSDRRIIDSDENEAKVDATLEALKVDVVTADTGILATIEETLTNLEKATATVDTDKLIVQREDAAGNVAPAGDVAARKGFVQITDGTNILVLLDRGDAYTTATQGIPVMGQRINDERAMPIPVASFGHSDADKGANVLPVTPMTRELEEGARAHSNEACFSVSFGVDDIDSKTGFVLIDLSDAANYPHTLTTEIHIDWISIVIHGNTTSTGQIHVGFISAIDADKGTLHVVAGLAISKLETITHTHKLFAPSAVRCKLAAHLSGGTELHTDDTTFQDDTALTATHATATPAVGDLCILIDVAAGTFEHSHVSVGYHTL